ncbi:Cell wall-associated hydrolase, NlpC family [Paenibacillaceae bacterium GAS479]|nr:Cell wall-associated hydrolase, NlpC family [Paenibacillaceae bacterium GAS479]
MRRLIWTGTAFAMLASAGGTVYAEPSRLSSGAKNIPGPDARGASSAPYANANADTARILAGMAPSTTAPAATVGGSADSSAGKTTDGKVGILSAESDSPISEKGPLSSQALGGAIADYALDYLGTPYKYGGSSPAGLDASGFLYYIYRNSAAEIELPRTIAEQFKSGSAVGGQSLLLPGDAVFFHNSGSASFAGIYIGNHEFAAATVDGVKLSSLSSPYWQERYAGARRMTGGSAGDGGNAGRGNGNAGSGSGSSNGNAGGSGSGSGSSNGNAGGSGSNVGSTMQATTYFKGITGFLSKAKPVLSASTYNRLEEKADLAFQQYEQGRYTEMLATHEEILDSIEALSASELSRIGVKSGEIYGSSFSVGLYDINVDGSLKARKETGYTMTSAQQTAADQLWKQVRLIYPKSYLSLVKQLRLEVHRGGISRVETLGKGQVRLVIDPSDLTPTAKEKTRWALVRELGKLVTQQGPAGAELDHIGSASSGLDGAGGMLGSAFAGPASGSSQWAYYRKDSLMTRFYTKFWTPEVISAARAGKPMTTLYTKLFFREASAYQVQEDIADAWAAFVLYDKPVKPADRRDEKMLFFYSSSNLTTIRTQARSGMGLTKSYPKTTTVTDLIGPRTW